MGIGHSTPHEIIPNLWLGNIDSALSETFLDTNNIRSVIDLSGENYDIPKSNCAIERSYCRIDISDEPTSNLKKYFNHTYTIIRNALIDQTCGIYVHCIAGVSRSCTIIAAYLIKEYGLTADQALAQIRLKRTFVKPNKGFLRQLNEYYEELYQNVNLE
jgi:protein-tyrosine phosphatase